MRRRPAAAVNRSRCKSVNDDNHFSLFGLPERFTLNLETLQAAWRDVSSRVHPDRFATASAAERRVAMQWAARANEAYRQLRDPLARARYMCERAGVDLQAETNTSMAPEFLMQQMSWRESLDDARESEDPDAFAALDVELLRARQSMNDALANLLDEQHDFTQAAQRVREWMFVEKMAEAIERDRPAH
jgi:molecular chaperone HscB